MHFEFILGTRPEITKCAHIIEAFIKNDIAKIEILITGQQTTLVNTSIENLEIRSLINELWLGSGPMQDYYHGWREKATIKLRSRWKLKKPDAILVIGDTSSALLGAEIANHLDIPIIHLEAGIRLEKNIDMNPEEEIRRRISKYTLFHIVPTDREFENLINEGVPPNRIAIEGDLSKGVTIFVYKRIPKKAQNARSLNKALEYVNIPIHLPLLSKHNGFVLCTLHRPSSLQNQIPLANCLMKLQKHAKHHTFVLCKRPDSRWDNFYEIIENESDFIILDALPPSVFQLMIKHSFCIITDSAGVQQESILLGKRVIAMRSEVELYNEHPRLFLFPPPFKKISTNLIDFCQSEKTWNVPNPIWANQGLKIAIKIKENIQNYQNRYE